MTGAHGTRRTIAIGDVHGERAALDRLLARLPALTAADTVVFLGDYFDRGPDARGVVDRLRRLPAELAARVVCLRGNHEDAWLTSLADPDIGFLMPPGNGCAASYYSFTGAAPNPDGTLPGDDVSTYYDPRRWIPAAVIAWLHTLPLWYEDDHAIYVHAGVEPGPDGTWRHPRDSPPRALLWHREPEFWERYAGKRVVFGHTPTFELPPVDPDRFAPWRRGPLWGLDTGAGRGGPISAVVLPDGDVITSD